MSSHSRWDRNRAKKVGRLVEPACQSRTVVARCTCGWSKRVDIDAAASALAAHNHRAHPADAQEALW